jgi:hypothetical protein
MRSDAAPGVAVIRVDAIWMSTEPLDMRPDLVSLNHRNGMLNLPKKFALFFAFCIFNNND